jgi:hypothetical protein
MDPITWATLIPIIAKYGLPLAERLWQNAANNAPVTPAEWKALRELNETPFDALVPKRPGD